jgi:hypothetical protein
MSKVKLLFELHKRKGFQFEGKKKFNLQTVMVNAFKMTPENAFKYLQSKGGNMAKTWSYKDMNAKAHQKAFTVAKIMEADLLQDIYDEIAKAKQEGIPLSDFRKNLEPKLQNRGWIGGEKEQLDPNTGESKLVKLTPNRLKVIYDTNMQTSFSKGKYRQQALLAERYPILVYKQVQRNSKRHTHAKFHNKAFRFDNPIWKSIYPPSDFACHCSVIQMSEKEAEAKGYKVSDGAEFKDVLDTKGEFNISSVEAWEPDTSKYVDGIKGKLEAMLKQAGNYKPKAEPKPIAPEPPKPSDSQQSESVKFMADEFKNKLGIDMPEEFTQLFETETPLVLEKSKSKEEDAWFSPSENKIHIGSGERFMGSELCKKMIICHEGMHSVHINTGILTNESMSEPVKNLQNDLMDAFGLKGTPKEISEALKIIQGKDTSEAYRKIYLENKTKYSNTEMTEMLLQVRDIIGSMTKGKLGGGHNVSYYRTGNQGMMEVLANGSSIYFNGNPFLEGIFPEIHNILIKFFDDMVKVKK